MKHVTMIAHAFPPEGNAGTYRPLRFVGHLPSNGWTPSIVSAAASEYERFDPGLLRLVPRDVEVVRVAARDLWQTIQAKRSRHLQKTGSAAAVASGPSAVDTAAHIRSLAREAVRTAEAWCYHPDMCMAWIRPAVAATVSVVRRNHSDVIWATAGPVSAFVVASRASEATGTPYVLDFRDAWTITYNEFEARRPSWAIRQDRRALYRYLRGARAVTFRYRTEAECYWQMYPGALEPSRIHIIPNGFEGPVQEPALSRGERCTVLYAGTLSSYRYDTFLQALQALQTSRPERAGQLRILVVGEGSGAFAADAAARGLSTMVETAGPVSHAEIARLERDAHALLVLGRPPTMKGYELFAGAKLFGYLKAGRPIIGVLPRDETRRILEHVGAPTIADADSHVDIQRVLERVLESWSAQTLASLVPIRSACEEFSAVRQTAALARALEGRPALEPFVPNSVDVPRSLRDDIQRGGLRSGVVQSAGERDAVLHS